MNRGIRIKPKRLNASEYVEAVSAIDGATIYDPHGMCYGMGMILDGPAVVLGAIERGSRFNSSRNYIVYKYTGEAKEGKELYFAAVFSEDGMVDCISPFFEENGKDDQYVRRITDGKNDE